MLVGKMWCLPRDAMLARYVLSSCIRPSVRPSVCLSQADIVSKRLDGFCWLLAWELPLTHPKLCYLEILLPPKIKIVDAMVAGCFRRQDEQTRTHARQASFWGDV